MTSFDELVQNVSESLRRPITVTRGGTAAEDAGRTPAARAQKLRRLEAAGDLPRHVAGSAAVIASGPGQEIEEIRELISVDSR